MNASQKSLALQSAMLAVKTSLRSSPAFMVAVAIAAGMASSEAKAWGNNQFEHLGRTVGNEVGRQAGGGGFSTESRIGGIVGGMLGSSLGRPYDEQSKEQQRIERIEAQAREQAIRDAAYEEQRRRIDPNYQRTPNYGSQVHSSRKSNTDYEAIRRNIERAAYDAHRKQRGESAQP